MAKYCSECGSELNENQDVCLKCGKMIKNNNSVNGKSKIIAAVLALLFGPLGIHNFYLGYNGKGVAQLLISVITCGFGTIITWPWAIFEAILIISGSMDKDANGDNLV